MASFKSTLLTEEINISKAATHKRGFDPEKSKGIPDSKSLTGIVLRAKKIYINDNLVTKIWPFSGKADLYLISAVFDDISKEPQSLSIKGFEGVDDDQYLTLDAHLYYWKQKNQETAPGKILSILQIVKSNEGVRDFGKALTKLKESTEYKSLAESIAVKIASGGADIIYEAANAFIGLIGSILSSTTDAYLITDVKSFTDITGDFNNLGDTKIFSRNENVWIDYILTVQDSDREKNL